MYEVYRVRRKVQYAGWIYSPDGKCDCSSGGKESPCSSGADKCTGITATGCTCQDSGYCGMGSGGACGIAPHMYGGHILIVQAGDPRKEHILNRRFVVFDPTLPTADELLKQEAYRIITGGEPQTGRIVFSPKGEVIQAPRQDINDGIEGQALDAMNRIKESADIVG
jgi:hypothetical protein